METSANVLPGFKIMIVDDNEFYTKILSGFLKSNLNKLAIIKGFALNIISCTSFKCFTENMDNSVDLLFTDYYLNDGHNGSHIMDFIKHRALKCKIVMVSQVQTMQTSFLTSLAGTYEFVKKDEKTLFECNGIAETIIAEKLRLTN